MAQHGGALSKMVHLTTWEQVSAFELNGKCSVWVRFLVLCMVEPVEKGRDSSERVIVETNTYLGNFKTSFPIEIITYYIQYSF